MDIINQSEKKKRSRYNINIQLSVMKHKREKPALEKADSTELPSIPRKQSTELTLDETQGGFPNNKASFMLTELTEQETLLKNRIQYLKNKESRILRNLEEKSRMAEIYDSSRNRRDNQTDMAQSQVVWELSKQFQMRQKLQARDVILEKKLSHYQYRITSAERQRQRSQFEEKSKQRLNEFELRNRQIKALQMKRVREQQA